MNHVAVHVILFEALGDSAVATNKEQARSREEMVVRSFLEQNVQRAYNRHCVQEERVHHKWKNLGFTVMCSLRNCLRFIATSIGHLPYTARTSSSQSWRQRLAQKTESSCKRPAPRLQALLGNQRSRFVSVL